MLLWVDGMNYGSTGAGTARYTQSWAGIPSTGRFGDSQGCQAPSTSTPFAILPAVASGGRIMGGFWFFANGAGTAQYFVQFRNAARTQYGYLIVGTGAGLVSVTQWNSSSAAYTASSGGLHDSAWHWVEFDITFADSGSAKIWVDGVQVLNTGTVDLNNSGTPEIAEVGFTSGGNGFYYDDLVFWDNSGSGMTAADSPIGPVKIQQLYPSSDAAVAWSRSTGATNYTLVDDTAPSFTDYVQSATPGQIDRYGYTDLVGTPLAIKGASLVTFARIDVAALASYRAILRSGGVTYNGTTQVGTATAKMTTELYDFDPATSAEWTATNINAVEAGVEFVS